MIVVSSPTKLTQLDEQTFDNMSQMIKAALPYMNTSSARTMAMLARFIEMRNTMKYFNQPPAALSACSIGKRRPSTEEMLMDIRKYCDGREAEAIDKLLGALKIGKFYEQFKEMEKNPDFCNLFRAMNQYGAHSPNEDNRGGENHMNNSFNPEQLLKNMNPEMLKNINPEMFKNFNPEMLKNLNPEMFKNFNPEMLNNFNTDHNSGNNAGNGFNPEMLKNINPDILKNFDMNKFNQLMSAMNMNNNRNDNGGGRPAGGQQGRNAGPGDSGGGVSAAESGGQNGGYGASGGQRNAAGAPGANGGPAGGYSAGGPGGSYDSAANSGFDAEQLKSMLTPEQLQMFESIAKSMNNKEP